MRFRRYSSVGYSNSLRWDVCPPWSGCAAVSHLFCGGCASDLQKDNESSQNRKFSWNCQRWSLRSMSRAISCILHYHVSLYHCFSGLLLFKTQEEGSTQCITNPGCDHKFLGILVGQGGLTQVFSGEAEEGPRCISAPRAAVGRGVLQEQAFVFFGTKLCRQSPGFQTAPSPFSGRTHDRCALVFLGLATFPGFNACTYQRTHPVKANSGHRDADATLVPPMAVALLCQACSLHSIGKGRINEHSITFVWVLLVNCVSVVVVVVVLVLVLVLVVVIVHIVVVVPVSFLLLLLCCCLLVVHVLVWSSLSKLTSSCVVHYAIGRSSPMITWNYLWSMLISNHFLSNFHFVVDIRLHAIAAHFIVAHFNECWGWSSWWCLPDRGIWYRLFGIDSWTSMWQRFFEIDSGPCPRNILFIENTNAHCCHYW